MKIELTPTILILLVVAVAAALFVGDRAWPDDTRERLAETEALQAEVERLKMSADTAAVRVDSLAAVVDSLVASRTRLREIADSAVAAAVRAESGPEEKIEDAALAARFDSVVVISPGLFAIGHDLLADYEHMARVTLPNYRQAVSDLLAARAVDSLAVDRLLEERQARAAEAFALRAALASSESAADGYRGLYETSNAALKRERRLRRATVAVGAAAIIGVIVLAN